jgi:serine/threonine protein kinase/WD40 repeat protein/tetratricopeptide (TPR) repeat protein
LILDSFLARFRKGERPSLTEYIARYPALADEIRDLLPALVEIEQLGSVGGASGAGLGELRPVPGSPGATDALDPAAGPAAAGTGTSVGAFPQRLGDYRILRTIGAGGMGVVYEAVRESLKSHVALKVIHPRYRTHAGYLRRFHNEARSAAHLHHTNIVSVFDYGEHDGICYCAMQYIAGHSLEEILEDVRRLRASQGQEQVMPAREGSGAREDGELAPLQAVHGPVEAERQAATDPFLRTVTHGLLTGQFALEGVREGDRSPVAIGAVPELKSEPQPGSAHTQLGPEAASLSSPAPRTPDSGASLSSSSLAGQGEDRYHREVARLGAQVADALAHAHKRGVLHRDIKPSNLLLDAVGNVWVTDFGLAKFEEGEDLSQSQDLVGTLRYMAPERFRGVSDRRCDLYALGATLYELLNLRPAFDSHDRVRLIDQIVHDPPAPPRQLDRRIPRDLETIVLKALAKDPTDRFATADELAAELRRFLENRPIRSRPIPAYERLWRWCKRNRALAALIALAAGLTIFLAIGSTVAAWRFREQNQELRFEKSLTEVNLHRAEHAEHNAQLALSQSLVSEHNAQLALGQSLVSEGAALQRTGLIGQRFKSLDLLGQAAKILGADPEGRKRLPEIRNHAIAALGLTDLRIRWEHDRGDVWGIDIDAALERYAIVERPSGAVIVRRLDDDRELVRLPGPDRLRFLEAGVAFSPEGELLVGGYRTAGEGTLLRIWHLERRELIGSLSSRGGPVFQPDGRRLLFKAPEGDIAIWDRRERRVVRRLPLDFETGSNALDPEGRRLAVNNTDWEKPRVMIIELETGHVLADWRSQVGNSGLAWSADGQLLAIGGGRNDPHVYVWNVRRGALASVLQGHRGAIGVVQFAHSGYLLATTAWDGTRLWDAASGEPLAMAAGYFTGFSPDDRRLAFGREGKIGVWDVAAGTECRVLHPAMLGNRTDRRDDTVVPWADVSPDGRLVATCDKDGVRLWEADTGRELAHLKTSDCDRALFHPDGQSLISSGWWGLYRWPIRPDPDRGPDAVRVGPLELLRESAGSWCKAAWLPDHRTLALVEDKIARVWLVDSSHPHPAWSHATALDSGENRRMSTVSVSPDGRWLAVGGWYEAGVRVWDLQRRRLERILRPKDAVSQTKFWAGFSSDGRWLVSSTHPDDRKAAYHFWRVGTWELGQRIVPNSVAELSPAFANDGRLMALRIAPDQVLLAEAATGRELARLTTPQPVHPTPLVFSPDGTKLIASTGQKTALVWDLRRIRDQLALMRLDWDAPPYPAASAASEPSGPLPPPRPVRVIGEVIETQARRAAEFAEMNCRLAANPDDAGALIHRGWLFHQQKKWPESIADLENLLRLRPDDSDACWLLAEANQEMGNLAGALAAFSWLLAVKPNDRDARFQRGLLALAVARPEIAADDFSRILAAEPDLEHARYRRAQALVRLGRHREALADLDILTAKEPPRWAWYRLRSIVRDALGDHESARADREKAMALSPKDAMALNESAWTLATGPIEERDPERAVDLARRAVELAPGQQLSLNTLGVALYRVGQYAEAIPILEQSRAAAKGEFDAFDLFFLAMAHHRLGHADRARACFDRAVRWWTERKNLPAQYISDLTSFRAEAESVLALPGRSAELPATVFAPE